VKQLSQFAFAGTIGFFVDALSLWLVYPWTGAYAGRFISFSCAVITTWLINRSLTFRHQLDTKPLHTELALYFASTLVGGVVNLLAYFLVVYLFALSVAALPIAVAVGSLAGMLVNYTLTRRLVFTGNADN